jgi:hypothetical protein
MIWRITILHELLPKLLHCIFCYLISALVADLNQAFSESIRIEPRYIAYNELF